MQITTTVIDDYWTKIDEIYHRKQQGRGDITLHEREAIWAIVVAMFDNWMLEHEQLAAINRSDPITKS